MTSDKTKDVPGVEEQRRITEEINQRLRKECVWNTSPYSPYIIVVGCRSCSYGSKDTDFIFCPYCGGKLVVK